MLPVQCAHHAEQDADREQAQERIEDTRAAARSRAARATACRGRCPRPRRPAERAYRPMKCVAAYTSDASTMASRAPDSRAIAVCMAPRRKVSSMQRHGEAGDDADQDQAQPSRATSSGAPLRARACRAATIVTSAGIMSTTPSTQRLADLGDELARAASRIRGFRRSATLSRRAANTKPTTSSDMRDAARDAMELGVVEQRRDQQPGRVGEQRDAGECRARSGRGRSRSARTAAVSASTWRRVRATALWPSLLEQCEQAVAAHEMQRAHDHQVVAVFLEQRLDLRQPLAIARAQQRVVELRATSRAP